MGPIAMAHYERKDYFWRKAKAEGFRSRAAYKLIQLQKCYRIIRKGDRVVDLGCAPGGWLRVIAEAVGPGGRVVGLDRRPMEPFPVGNAFFVRGDIRDEQTAEEVVGWLGARADVVTSDMAPDLSGIAFRDHHSACELVIAGMDFCKRVLKPGGVFLAKAFQGEELVGLQALMKEAFGSVKRIVPDASRKGSSEVYFSARDFLPEGKRSVR